MIALVAGWFSFENGHATAGDLLSKDLACQWLIQAGYSPEVAIIPSLGQGVDWRQVNPEDYDLVVFVCGPFEKGELETAFFERFGAQRLVGLNLSMQLPLSEWNPFDLLIERDSSARSNPDLVFLSNQPHVPVVGICLVEYYEGERVEVEVANSALRRLAAGKEAAVIEIDTRLDENQAGLRSPAEIESLIARVDVLLTTRLHGLVLALKNGVPVLAIDPVSGGAKIVRQAERIGWPVIFSAGSSTEEDLRKAFKYCFTAEARRKAIECRDRAISLAEELHAEFLSALAAPEKIEVQYQARLARAEALRLANEVDHSLQEGPGKEVSRSFAGPFIDRLKTILNSFARRT